MEVLLKKLRIFFLGKSTTCSLFFFTCPVGIFDLYVSCSALCIFMDGQEIIPFFRRDQQHTEKAPGQSLPRLFHWYSCVYLHVPLRYATARHSFKRRREGFFGCDASEFPVISKTSFFEELYINPESTRQKGTIFLDTVSAADSFLCFR